MIVLKRIEEMRSWSRQARLDGHRIGFVPTMGYLHQGHLSLVHLARQHADRIVLSIFVNPTQFGPKEDLDRYPRDFKRDETLCRDCGVDVIFYPDVEQMYPADFSSWVVEEALSAPLCGTARPGHFRGVTTIVAKLFNIVQPDVAAFGRKDAQQALVIQRMVRDLDFPIEILVGSIIRESDGLAMSSRNRYLDSEQRRRATSIHHGLQAAKTAFAQGDRNVDSLIRLVRTPIENSGGRIDYIELLRRDTLAPFPNATADAHALLAVAAFFGATRLIDNAFLD